MIVMLLGFFVVCGNAEAQLDDSQSNHKVEQHSHPLIIVDTHIDVPYRLQAKMEDISVRTTGGEFDYPRAREGGLNVPFMSIYVPASYEEKGGGKKFADRLIHIVKKFATDAPEKFAVAYSVADVRKHVANGLIALVMGMENGTPIERKLGNVKYFHKRGIRYITLAHSRNNHICDSSYDPKRTWNGLSPFGKKVVQEMNRVGIMIDVSHISDSAFYQVIRLTKAPVIASHSSCRHFTPGFERNMSDEMIRELARNGGVIQINFGSEFLRDDVRKRTENRRSALNKYYEAHNLKRTDSAAVAYAKKFRDENPPLYADVSDVVTHIDHVVKLVGVNHVGLGSDFDGVGDSLPTGLKDVSQYPNLIGELRKKGYSEDDIRKICGENTLRVWSEVEHVSRSLQTR